MRIVIKVGTSTLTHEGGNINIRRFELLCKVISDIKNRGTEVILVSSGAIGMGVGKMHMSKRPTELSVKQALAAIGQCELMYCYDKLFSEYNHTVAQILLTAPDLSCDDRKNNFINTIESLMSLGALPIINENDTVTTEEIVFGDNDTLAAKVAVAVNADLLILLSDIDGLYTKDPHKYEDAELISEVRDISAITECGGDAGTSRGTGGMHTKIKAATIATESGVDMIIANGADPENLYDIIDGKPVGTIFYGEGKKI